MLGRVLTGRCGGVRRAQLRMHPLERRDRSGRYGKGIPLTAAANESLPAHLTIFAIDKLNLAAMRARNLLRQHQAHAAAGWLGRIERHKQILSVGDAQAAIFNRDRSR